MGRTNNLGDYGWIGHGNLKMLAGKKGRQTRKVVRAGDLVFALQNVSIWVAVAPSQTSQCITALDGFGDGHCLRKCLAAVILLNGME